MLKHFSNIDNPYLTGSFDKFWWQTDLNMPYQQARSLWKMHLDWCKSQIIGEPIADGYTSEQLRKMGLVGVYKNEEAIL